MVRLLLGIFRDLYIVLLIILIIEQIPGSDLLHDLTRKGVITVTVFVVVAKLIQPFVESPCGGPARAPRRQKKTEGGKSTLLEWASAEMQGWRPAMEDATCIDTSLPEPFSNQALFAVFDGHGGSQVSLIASREFPKVLTACAMNLLNKATEDGATEAASFASAESEFSLSPCSEPASNGHTPEQAFASTSSTDESDTLVTARHKDAEVPAQLTGKALHLTMLTLDDFLRQSPYKSNAFNLMGSTAIVVLVEFDSDGAAASSRKPRRVTVANCGDSRAVLCRKGKAVELSEDHKPELSSEEERIKKAGGHVAMIGPCYRVDGWGLNLSRALGDFHYKARTDLPPEQQKVIAVPEIRTLQLTEDDEFLVLGCDGIFELNTSQAAVDIVREGLQAGLNVEQVVEELVDRSCSSNLIQTRGKGGDNCSAIVVRFR